MYESNGPDVKIRGTASHIAEKYLQLARDAQSSGDPVAAENYYQHAEHYFRLIAAAQEQFRQSQPYYQQGGDQRGNLSDEGYDDGDATSPPSAASRSRRANRNHFIRASNTSRKLSGHSQPRPQQQPGDDEDVERLPSFITWRLSRSSNPQGQGGNGPHGPNGQGGPNGQNGYDGSADRFPLHRRRRRHRGPRDHAAQGGESDAPSGPRSDD